MYELTDKGHAAFRSWLTAPSSYPSLRALRDDLPRLEALCDTFEERAHAIPHRTKAIVLELSLVRRLLSAHRDWIDDVERELGTPS